MADYVLLLTTLTVLGALSLVISRAILGRPRSIANLVGHLTVAVFVSIALTGMTAYRLSGSRTFQLGSGLVHRVDTPTRVVALTFDDGPTPEYTNDVLETLAAYDAPATFYLTGAESYAHPEALAAIIAAGHELGNHTYSHQRMVLKPASVVASELERTDAAFRAAGYVGPLTFRPPGCKRLLTTPGVLAQTGRTTVTWDLEPDSIDGVAEDDAAIARYVTNNVRPGSIVLLHVMYESRAPSRAALGPILQTLSEKGYRFVTVSELLALREDER